MAKKDDDILPGETVFINDGERFMPCAVTRNPGGHQLRLVVLSDGHFLAGVVPHRAPADYEGGFDPANLSNGGWTWCLAEELPDEVVAGS